MNERLQDLPADIVNAIEETRKGFKVRLTNIKKAEELRGKQKQLVMTINELSGLSHNLDQQLNILGNIKMPIDDVWRLLNGKGNSEMELRQMSYTQNYLKIYATKINSLINFAKGELSFESVPLVVDKDGNPTAGPEWAVEILKKNNLVQYLFSEVFPLIGQKRDYDKFSMFIDEVCNGHRKHEQWSSI